MPHISIWPVNMTDKLMCRTPFQNQQKLEPKPRSGLLLSRNIRKLNIKHVKQIVIFERLKTRIVYSQGKKDGFSVSP